MKTILQKYAHKLFLQTRPVFLKDYFEKAYIIFKDIIQIIDQYKNTVLNIKLKSSLFNNIQSIKEEEVPILPSQLSSTVFPLTDISNDSIGLIPYVAHNPDEVNGPINNFVYPPFYSTNIMNFAKQFNDIYFPLPYSDNNFILFNNLIIYLLFPPLPNVLNTITNTSFSAVENFNIVLSSFNLNIDIPFSSLSSTQQNILFNIDGTYGVHQIAYLIKIEIPNYFINIFKNNIDKVSPIFSNNKLIGFKNLTDENLITKLYIQSIHTNTIYKNTIGIIEDDPSTYFLYSLYPSFCYVQIQTDFISYTQEEYENMSNMDTKISLLPLYPGPVHKVTVVGKPFDYYWDIGEEEEDDNNNFNTET